MTINDHRKLSALVVGFGSIGRRHARILRELGLIDISVCDPCAEIYARARDEFDIAATFDCLESGLACNPNTVFICSPTALHVEQAIEAMQAGTAEKGRLIFERWVKNLSAVVYEVLPTLQAVHHRLTRGA